MMVCKFLTTAIALNTLIVALPISAQTYISPDMESRLVKICEAIKSDSKKKLHFTLKDTHINYRQVTDGLVCNGQDAVTFALTHNATNTAKHLAKKSNLDYQQLLSKR